MNSKNGRVNHDFQIVHFLAGSCHTPDGAYALLCDLRDDRALALEAAKEGLTDKNKMKESVHLRELVAVKINGSISADVHARNIAAAQAELATINRCIEHLQPLRKYAHLPDAEAHEACQAEEWKLELIFRAENFLLNGGQIPADHFAAMRQHPAFTTDILPAVQTLLDLIKLETIEPGKGRKQIYDRIATRAFNPALLLEHKGT